TQPKWAWTRSASRTSRRRAHAKPTKAAASRGRSVRRDAYRTTVVNTSQLSRGLAARVRHASTTTAAGPSHTTGTSGIAATPGRLIDIARTVPPASTTAAASRRTNVSVGAPHRLVTYVTFTRPSHRRTAPPTPPPLIPH